MEFKEFTLKLLREYAKIVDDNLTTMRKAIEDDKAEAIFSETFTKEIKKECMAHSRLINAVSVLARQNKIMDVSIEKNEEKSNFEKGLVKCKSFKELFEYLFDLDEEEENE